tara:strand:- start:3217 stop:3405 length:189 start_codon:yes stop_codon:yes gene_type:complete
MVLFGLVSLFILEKDGSYGYAQYNILKLVSKKLRLKSVALFISFYTPNQLGGGVYGRLIIIN